MTETLPEAPAEVLQRAAALMRKRAEAATPGPWERPFDTRHKNAVIAALPDDEQGDYLDGCIPASFASHKGLAGRYAGMRERVGVVSADILSIGGFRRKRSGRDLDHIAAMHPLVGLAVADLLDHTANLIAGNKDRFEATQSSVMAIIIAQAYLGEVQA